ncbi:M23 family metallopeptidase [Alkalihalobacillus trypoxylicola]|uniref:M23ase beta-sheet core domain-containing protein n=1 Tax=Alkalihalobacillus trypoxylicola TaxID=519424 RepID=A0A162E771_9BACI|nr:M23 family metallopeptidase [Alkalihalobacillus trypoxylicola]KYG31940.1 hypothetical protein AZF04_03965 [Alkalihalobacillus trypoxylicola]
MAKNEVNPDNFIELWIDEKYEVIYRNCSEDFKKMIAFDHFINLARSFNEDVEKYTLFVSTESLRETKQFVWIDDKKEKAISVSFNKKNHIVSLYLKPFSEGESSDSILTKNHYNMPINSQWYVFWGGTNEFINYHYELENQRYAYDLVKVNRGSTFNHKGLRNKDYYAFDQEIVAPFDGTVVNIQDGIKDNVPGLFNKEKPAGNFIIIKHANQEYSMIAHLKRNSIMVAEGDSVSKGQFIAKCGNSGNSSEPHIHYQIMNTHDFERAKSIRIQFTFEEPIKGDYVLENDKVMIDKFDERFDKIESSSFFLDLFLVLRKAIVQFFT